MPPLAGHKLLKFLDGFSPAIGRKMNEESVDLGHYPVREFSEI